MNVPLSYMITLFVLMVVCLSVGGPGYMILVISVHLSESIFR